VANQKVSVYRRSIYAYFAADLRVRRVVLRTTPSIAITSCTEATSTTPIIGHPAVVEPEETLILPNYEQLQKNLIAPAASVAGVDPAHREKSLSDQDFYTVFKMTKTDFVQLPAWKRSSLKKKYGLF